MGSGFYQIRMEVKFGIRPGGMWQLAQEQLGVLSLIRPCWPYTGVVPNQHGGRLWGFVEGGTNGYHGSWFCGDVWRTRIVRFSRGEPRKLIF